MSIFEGGPDGNAMDLGFGPDPQPERPDNQGPATGGQMVNMTQEQFQQLLATLGQQRQELDYAAAIQGQDPEPLPEIDLSQLPDPRTDFEAFQTALAQGFTAARQQVLDAAQSQVNHTLQQRSTLDDAWALLRERHPDIATHEDIIGMAAQREMDDLRARGIDPLALLAQNMEAAVDRIAERAGSTISRVRGLQEGEPSDDFGRTDMISGGSPRPAARRPGADKPSNFTDELKKIQREMGIY